MAITPPPLPPLKNPGPALALSDLEELSGDPLIVHLDLGDHVAGHIAGQSSTLTPVEPVRILLTNYL